ncbi:hypothetical protein [Flavobacterium sp. 102]|uniref:hypothetical protein n=1 Tax=Flavobacterium sp. 102 TaxID=2135623 RepID=UPI000EB143FA|nr:hypothetical protein [Flavobacterium sp. 102]RKS01450.1 hypothetical protein C8C84_1110 [Flavobacterium sp. 102]
MDKLQSKYPNFVEAMESMKQGTDTRMISSDKLKIKYLMSLVAYNSKIGDVQIELNAIGNSNVTVTLSTLTGFTTHASTNSRLISNDLSVEQWNELIYETMIEHNSNPDHQKVAMDFLKKRLSNNSNGKSGCLSVFLSFMVLTAFLYLIR